MKILAIDTASPQISVAVWENSQPVSQDVEPYTGKTAAFLPLWVKKSLQEANLELNQLDHILVNKGPGSFTGIRIGLSFVKGLYLGTGIKIAALDGFQVEWQNLSNARCQDVLITLDGKRSDFFCQLWQKGIPCPPRIMTVQEIKQLCNTSTMKLAGNAAENIAEELTKEALIIEILKPQWRGAHGLAYCYFKSPDLFGSFEPYYLRPPDIHKSHVPNLSFNG